MKEDTVRVSEKPIISTLECCALFSIGRNKLLQIIANNPRAEWLLRDGNRYRIKRQSFEEWILSQSSI